MNAFQKKGVGIALLLFAYSGAHAQINLSKLEFGLTAGTLIYQGDLTPSQFGSYRTLRPFLCRQKILRFNTSLLKSVEVLRSSLPS